MNLDILAQAIDKRTTLKIRYLGGYSPGTISHILPLELRNGKLWAHCRETRQTKGYTLEKIEILPETASQDANMALS